MYEDEISRIAFADPDMVRHLLALLPADATAGLDTRRLRRLPTEQIGRGVRRRMADMAWAVGAPTPERPDAEALLAIEFQTAPHARMALRMDAYVALLRQEMAARLPSAAGLPPALPVLVYTGDRPWRPPGLRRLTAPAPPGLPELAAALFGALRRDGRSELAERLSDALVRMLAARFGGDETGERHTEELRRALRRSPHCEEPRMLAETVTQWRREALDEGRKLGRRQGMSEGRKLGMSEGRRQGMSEGRRQGMSEGMSHERALLRRLAAGRFGVAAGDALAALLANEEDVDRLAEVGDLVVGCTSAEELLRRGRGLLNGGS